MKIVYFDSETGGLTPTAPEIQWAAIAVDSDWNEIETMEVKVQFDESLADPEALRMNHYDPEIWNKEAVPERQACSIFRDFLNRHKSIEMTSKTGKPYSVARLAGHNAATFDNPRLQAMFKRHGEFLPAHPQVLCTLQRCMWYAVETGTQFKNLKLSTLCEHFGYPIPDAHDALADVRGSIAIARAIGTKLFVVPLGVK